MAIPFGLIFKGVGKLFGSDILKPIFGMIKDTVMKKRERRLAKMEAEIALEVRKAEVIMKKETADIEWDQIMAKNSKDSWKDEYITIIVSLPFIGAFIPVVQDYIMTGFTYLEQTPDDYKIAWMAVIAAAFGIRGLTRYRLDSTMKNGSSREEETK